MVITPKIIKKSKIKQRRRRIALIIILFILLLALYLIFRARDYEKKYQIKDYEIVEKFNKKKKIYFYQITKEDYLWEFIVEHKYINKRKLLTDIEWLETTDTICIIPKSEQLTTYPQCQKDSENLSFHLVSEEMKEKLGDSWFLSLNSTPLTYEKIDIKNIDDYTYYIWNYKGFYRVNKNQQQTIQLFDKDIYDISSVATVNDFLVIPDYNEAYYFNKFYLLDKKSAKTSTWEFKDSLYFDGYYLGKYKNSLFYIDRKTKIEWEIDPKKKRMRKIGTEYKEGKIFQNNDWQKISVTKLINEPQYFTNDEIYRYEINNGLYLIFKNSQIKKKITNRDVKEVIARIEDKVYYIAGHTLYYYSDITGEVEVMSYFEWNFNYKNMIFIQN
jgi:hypothetical protein